RNLNRKVAVQAVHDVRIQSNRTVKSKRVRTLSTQTSRSSVLEDTDDRAKYGISSRHITTFVTRKDVEDDNSI
ncbi:hypothetical protein L9F63_027222, partial [Diploptera punctata]